MKIHSKYLLLALLGMVFSFSELKAQYYTINALPMCWTTPGNVDSTIYMSQYDGSQKQKPDRYYYYNASGVKVTVSGGTLRWGRCDDPTTDSITVRLDVLIEDNDTIILNLQAIIDSLSQIITNTTDPQQCECTYSIDLENHQVTIGENQQQAIWSYDQVITRDCGAGFMEILRIPTNTITPKCWHMIDASTLSVGGGVIDSIMFATVNPTGTMKVYLSPAGVASHYPTLVSAGTVDTSYLRYTGPADTARLAIEMETVINYAITEWAATNGYSTPFRDIDVRPSIGASIYIYSNLINEPTAPTVGLYVNSLSKSRIWYHRNSATPWNGACANYAGAGKTVTHAYQAPCGPATVGYTTVIAASADNDGPIDTIVLYTSRTYTKFGQVDTTCTVPCPETVDNCIEICNPETNPIPVYLVEQDSANACQVQGIVEFPLSLSSSSATLPASYYHSVTVSITSGTVTLSAINTSGTTSATFSSGQTFTATARECELLPTSFTINATSGAATVATSR